MSRLPWVDHPLILLVARGATPMIEIEGGTLAELGTATAVEGNQDAATGIIDMPGARIAVLKAPDGNLVAVTQEVASEWTAG